MDISAMSFSKMKNFYMPNYTPKVTGLRKTYVTLLSEYKQMVSAVRWQIKPLRVACYYLKGCIKNAQKQQNGITGLWILRQHKL